MKSATIVFDGRSTLIAQNLIAASACLEVSSAVEIGPRAIAGSD